MNGMRKAHQTNKRESRYLILPDSPLFIFISIHVSEMPETFLKSSKKFLADIERTMGVQAFMMVGYIGKDEDPHSAM